jgi:hypothetical protein
MDIDSGPSSSNGATGPDCRNLPRYFVDSIGESRFRVIERWVSDGGYNVALVERIDDLEPEDEDEEEAICGEMIKQQKIGSKWGDRLVHSGEEMEVDGKGGMGGKAGSESAIPCSEDSKMSGDFSESSPSASTSTNMLEENDNLDDCPLMAFFQKNFKSPRNVKSKTNLARKSSASLKTMASSETKTSSNTTANTKNMTSSSLSVPSCTRSFASSLCSTRTLLCGGGDSSSTSKSGAHLKRKADNSYPVPPAPYHSSTTYNLSSSDKHSPPTNVASTTVITTSSNGTQKCCYATLSHLKSMILRKLQPLNPQQRLHFELLNGAPPPDDDPGMLSFWVANLLPVSEYRKYKLLGIRGVRRRIEVLLDLVEGEGLVMGGLEGMGSEEGGRSFDGVGSGIYSSTSGRPLTTTVPVEPFSSTSGAGCLIM